jgi:hypothetical protein
MEGLMKNLILGLICVVLVAGISWAADPDIMYTRYGMYYGKLVHQTTSYAVKCSDWGKVFDNKGATAAITLTLPKGCEDGFTASFVERDAYNVSVDVYDTTYQIIGLTNAAGDKITSSAIANTITLMQSGVKFLPLSSHGTWADGN